MTRTLRSVLPFVVDDGDEWVGVSAEEAAKLLSERLIVTCDGDCPKGTFHVMGTMQRVEERLEQIRQQTLN